MANIDRIQVLWTGGLGLPGITTFYSTPGGGHQADVVALFQALQPATPAGVSVEIPSTGDTIDDTTGELVGVWSFGTDTVYTGSAAGGYAAGVGALFSWSTAGIVAGRKVRGRTFIAPQASGQFDTNGSLTPAAQAFYVSHANDFLTAMGSDLLIWSRPTATRAGSSHSVVSVSVPDRPTSLVSRRR